MMSQREENMIYGYRNKVKKKYGVEDEIKNCYLNYCFFLSRSS